MAATVKTAILPGKGNDLLVKIGLNLPNGTLLEITSGQ